MKQALSTLFLTITIVGNSQDFKTNFAVANINFELTATADGKKVTKLCLNVVNPQKSDSATYKDDTICTLVNDMERNLFTNSIRTSLKGIVNDSIFKSIDSELKSLLDKKFDQYIFDQTNSEIVFGRDRYYGLSDGEIATYLEKKADLRKLHAELTTLKISLRKKSSGSGNSDDLKKVKNESINKLIEKNNIGDTVKGETISDANFINKRMQELKGNIAVSKASIKAITDKRKYQVSLIGNANSVSSFKTIDKSQLSAGFGIMANKPASTEFIGILTVAQTNDTIIGSGSDFGASVLVPGVRRFSLLTSYRSNSLDPEARRSVMRKIGFAANVNITPYNWLIKKTGARSNEDSIFAKVVPGSIDLMLSYNWVNIYEEGKDISIAYDFGLATRFISGDNSKADRISFLGNKRKIYTGFITGLNIKYNGLRVQFYLPIISGNNIKGLSGGQVYASIGFIGSILNSASSVLKKKEETTVVTQ